MQAAPLFDVPAVAAPEIPYPAFESSMGSTFVWETEDQADDDPDLLWRRAVALQMVMDRLAGLR